MEWIGIEKEEKKNEIDVDSFEKIASWHRGHKITSVV